ncbi:hypothetical protein KKB44_02540 [Candidatus Micrarchaeota archaeon]|nr:hypothetical protein [Candidatus Micrarchaeota archaeon]
MNKYLFSLLILFSSVYATSINNGEFEGTMSTWYFETDMQFTTDFTLSLVSGSVATGDPADLETGDIVCMGSVVRVTPTINTEWATPDFDVVALYPAWGPGYPAMITYSTVNTNRDIEWLSSSIFNNHKTFADANDYSQDISRYEELDIFYDQSVTYNNATGQFHSNKKGGANLFCKGTLQTRDGTTEEGTSSLPTTSSVDITLDGGGSHAISTRITGTECFGAVVKHPLDLDDPPWFWLDYFSHSPPSALSNPLGTTTKTLTVQEGGGTCDFHETDVVASGSTDDDLIMVRVTMENDGAQILITDVSSSNVDYTVEPFPVALCDVLGFPESICPASNGFEEPINTGSEKDLYVLIQRGVGASGGTVLTFDAETVSDSCGGAGTCSELVSLTGPITCEIEPPELEYGTLEVAEFLVSCEDLAGDPISCVGDDWYWETISGDFIERDNTHALAYPTSPPGSSGTLNYRSGIALCFSDIDVVSPNYECEFIPPSANMNTGDSQYFDLNCFVGGSASEPDDADYDAINGLDGSTSGSSTAGTTFNAGAESSGDLRGFAQWDDPTDDPVLGAVALAPITIGASNETDGDDDGSTEFCTIGDGPLTVYPGYSSWLSIKCGPDGNETCSSVDWSIDPPDVGSVSGNNLGADVTITGSPGESGIIWAVVGEDESCFKPFFISTPDCWEFS